MLDLLKQQVPGLGEKRAPDSEQHMRDYLEHLKPRGKGPDPIEWTYLDKTIPEIVKPVETVEQTIDRLNQQAETTKQQVDKVKDQIRSERGRLPKPTGSDLGPSFSLFPEEDQ